MKLILPLTILLLVMLGCGGDKGSVSKDETKPRTRTMPRVLVQKEKAGATGVYQQDLVVYPSVVVDGKPVEKGDHAFTIFSMASYKGKSPSCVEKSLALSISHQTNDIKTWGFSPGTKAAIVIDEEPLLLKIYSQEPYSMPAMSKYMKEPTPSEGLVISATCEMYQRLAKAKTIGFRIGDNASFDLDGAAVDNFREFANKIGFK